MAYDGGGGEVLAVDLAQQVVVDVRLPRHLAPSSLLLLLLRRRLRFAARVCLVRTRSLGWTAGWGNISVACGRLA
jgi:hypothetical protein